MKKAMRTVALLLCFAVSLTGCGNKTVDLLKQVQESGVLKVAIVANCEPYAYEDPAGSGNYTGSEVELVRQLAEQIGVSLELLPLDKETLVEDFLAQGAQMAIGRIADSDSVQYPRSLPYGTGKLYVATPAGVYFPTLSCFADTKLGASTQLSDPFRVLVSGATTSGVEYYKDTTVVVKGLLEGAISGYVCYDEQAKTLMKDPQIQVQSLYETPSESYVIIASAGGNGLIEQANLVINGLAAQ